MKRLLFALSLSALPSHLSASQARTTAATETATLLIQATAAAHDESEALQTHLPHITRKRALSDPHTPFSTVTHTNSPVSTVETHMSDSSTSSIASEPASSFMATIGTNSAAYDGTASVQATDLTVPMPEPEPTTPLSQRAQSCSSSSSSSSALLTSNGPQPASPVRFPRVPPTSAASTPRTSPRRSIHKSPRFESLTVITHPLPPLRSPSPTAQLTIAAQALERPQTAQPNLFSLVRPLTALLCFAPTKNLLPPLARVMTKSSAQRVIEVLSVAGPLLGAYLVGAFVYTLLKRISQLEQQNKTLIQEVNLQRGVVDPQALAQRLEKIKDQQNLENAQPAMVDLSAAGGDQSPMQDSDNQ